MPIAVYLLHWSRADYFVEEYMMFRAYPVQRAPALCGVWVRVSVASLTLACAM